MSNIGPQKACRCLICFHSINTRSPGLLKIYLLPQNGGHGNSNLCFLCLLTSLHNNYASSFPLLFYIAALANWMIITVSCHLFPVLLYSFLRTQIPSSNSILLWDVTDCFTCSIIFMLMKKNQPVIHKFLWLVSFALFSHWTWKAVCNPYQWSGHLKFEPGIHVI